MSGKRGSNSQLSDWKSDTLPIELLPHKKLTIKMFFAFKLCTLFTFPNGSDPISSLLLRKARNTLKYPSSETLSYKEEQKETQVRS